MQKQAMYGQLRWVDLMIHAAQVLSPLCHIVSIFIGASPLCPPLAFSSTIRGRKKAQGARLIEGWKPCCTKSPLCRWRRMEANGGTSMASPLCPEAKCTIVHFALRRSRLCPTSPKGAVDFAGPGNDHATQILIACYLLVRKNCYTYLYMRFYSRMLIIHAVLIQNAIHTCAFIPECAQW